jgi:ankyrin repeat domain-containing protein 50
MLKSCRKESTLREKLEQLPRDLDETYDRILQNIVEEDANEAFAALQWLAYSERPLYLAELAEAVVLRPDKCSLDKRDRLLDTQLGTGPTTLGLLDAIQCILKRLLCSP